MNRASTALLEESRMYMIHIDIYVPLLDESFEFRCDEEAPVSGILKDVYDVLTFKLRIRESLWEGKEGDKEKEEEILPPTEWMDKTKQGFWLCDIKGERILSGKHSLKEQGIIQGGKLVFF